MLAPATMRHESEPEAQVTAQRTLGQHWGLRRRGATRGAFTLVEMLVSLAVLTMALGIIGAVFAVTTRTASTAAAYSETHNWARQWMLQIQEDLAHCEPSGSILVLVGRTQAAGLTQGDLEAGKFHRVLVGDPAQIPAGYDPEYAPNLDLQYSNPRADILMFFSNRPTVSQAPPANPSDPAGQAYASGGKFAPIQVVYGHAALGEAVLSGSAYQFPGDGALRHIDWIDGSGTTNPNNISIIPANRWHLARRATIIEPTTQAVYSFDLPTLRRITRCQADNGAEPALAGDAARLNLAEYLDLFGPGSSEPQAPVQRPYEFAQWPNSALYHQLVYWLLYLNGGGDTNHHFATVLESVPVELRSNMGLHLLPGCAWFQVEFLMPEDPRNSLEYSSPDPSNPNLSPRSDMTRWTAVEAGQTYVFVPDTAANRELVSSQVDPFGVPLPETRLGDDFGLLDPTGPNTLSNRRVCMWPYAIRVTVRVYDPRGRLEQPIVRSIVHRFE